MASQQIRLVFVLRTGYNGLDVSTYREGDDDYDITIQLSPSDRKVTDVLRDLVIPAPSGKLVPTDEPCTDRIHGKPR